MGIYIKGMEMPKNCDECRMVEGGDDWFCHAADKWFDDEWFVWPQYEDGYLDTSKPLNCPLIEVTEPHGRLIDADKAVKDYHKYGISHMYDAFDLPDIMADSPTVIEGSE